jgi:hypothetical protein
MGMEPTYSLSGEDFTPDPCNTPRPSTPYCAREREYLKATMDWAGMYDRLDDREEALAKARSDRSRSTTPSSSSSSSTAKDGGLARATSIPSGLSEKGKKESAVWKTAFEDTLSKEELGRQLDEQAAQAKNNACDDSDSDSDDDEYGSSKSLFRAVPESDTEDEEEPEMPRNSVFRAWNDVDSDDEDQVDEDGKEGDSDDDISECDIEPDPSSPSTSSTPCGENLSSSESPSEPPQVNQVKETEKRIEKERERETGTEPEKEMESEREKGKEHQQEKVVPTPHVRPNARSFLQMFFCPPVDSTPVPASDDQGKHKELQAITTATEETLALSDGENEVAKDEVAETPPQPTYDVDNKGANPTLAKDMLRSADSDDDNQPSRVLSVNQRGSDEEEDDYEEGEKETPDTSFDSHSDAEIDEKEAQTSLHLPFRRLEDDDESDPESTCKRALALSGPCADSNSYGDDDEDEDEDEEGEDGEGDEHYDNDDASSDDANQGGNDGDKADDDNDDNVDKDIIDGDANGDDKNIQDDSVDTRGHGENYANNRTDTRDQNYKGGHTPDDPYAGMTIEEIIADPRDLGPDWDKSLSWSYRNRHPNPKYNYDPLEWWTDELDDEWSVAVDWYQGGPDPDPRDIEWECPLTHEGRRYRVIKYTEATEYRRYTQEEADATFCYGRWNYERHARWLEEKLVDLERWRKVELTMNLMINWRVRTGQQHTLCDGWWFMNKGQRWWETDWRYRWRGAPCYPYG